MKVSRIKSRKSGRKSTLKEDVAGKVRVQVNEKYWTRSSGPTGSFKDVELTSRKMCNKSRKKAKETSLQEDVAGETRVQVAQKRYYWTRSYGHARVSPDVARISRKRSDKMLRPLASQLKIIQDDFGKSSTTKIIKLSGSSSKRNSTRQNKDNRKPSNDKEEGNGNGGGGPSNPGSGEVNGADNSDCNCPAGSIKRFRVKSDKRGKRFSELNKDLRSAAETLIKEFDTSYDQCGRQKPIKEAGNVRLVMQGVNGDQSLSLQLQIMDGTIARVSVPQNLGKKDREIFRCLLRESLNTQRNLKLSKVVRNN